MKSKALILCLVLHCCISSKMIMLFINFSIKTLKLDVVLYIYIYIYRERERERERERDCEWYWHHVKNMIKYINK